MKRIAVIVTLVMAMAAMSKTPAIEPMPAACDVLQAIDIAATLGPGTTYVPGTQIENKSVRMSLCSADTPDLSARMTLMVRENLVAQVPDAATLRSLMIDELRATIGQTTVINEVDIGDAAIWAGEIGQLIVWHRTGRVMFIFMVIAVASSPIDFASSIMEEDDFPADFWETRQVKTEQEAEGDGGKPAAP